MEVTIVGIRIAKSGLVGTKLPHLAPIGMVFATISLFSYHSSMFSSLYYSTRLLDYTFYGMAIASNVWSILPII